MKNRIGGNRFELGNLVSYGRENKTFLDRLCALLLALSPIFQHYKGPVENAGFTVLIICFPILALRFLSNFNAGRINRHCISAVIPLLIFELYAMVDHRVAIIKLFYYVFVFMLFLFAACGSMNMTFFLHYTIGISCISAVLLVVQYISFYCFHYPLDLRPFGLLLDGDFIWVSLSETTGAGRMLRPAAFFMEPSHLFLYSFPSLFVLLLTPGITPWRINKALLITASMILSTSGMGIAAVVGAWSLYYVFFSGRITKSILRKIFSVRTFIIVSACILFVIATYFTVPFFRKSIDRIIIGTGTSNAITGRIRRAGTYIRTIHGKAVFFGTPNVVSGLDYNLAGFFATYIKWGIIGVFLTSWFYLQGVFKLKYAYKWMSIIIVVVSFFSAHTHGTFYMLYYVFFLMEGYHAAALKADGRKWVKGVFYG